MSQIAFFPREIRKQIQKKYLCLRIWKRYPWGISNHGTPGEKIKNWASDLVPGREWMTQAWRRTASHQPKAEYSGNKVVEAHKETNTWQVEIQKYNTHRYNQSPWKWRHKNTNTICKIDPLMKPQNLLIWKKGRKLALTQDHVRDMDQPRRARWRIWTLKKSNPPLCFSTGNGKIDNFRGGIYFCRDKDDIPKQKHTCVPVVASRTKKISYRDTAMNMNQIRGKENINIEKFSADSLGRHPTASRFAGRFHTRFQSAGLSGSAASASAAFLGEGPPPGPEEGGWGCQPIAAESLADSPQPKANRGTQNNLGGG